MPLLRRDQLLAITHKKWMSLDMVQNRPLLFLLDCMNSADYGYLDRIKFFRVYRTDWVLNSEIVPVKGKRFLNE